MNIYYTTVEVGTCSRSSRGASRPCPRLRWRPQLSPPLCRPPATRAAAGSTPVLKCGVRVRVECAHVHVLCVYVCVCERVRVYV
jgi:hypothetical protein